MRERHGPRGKQRADPEDDPKISQLPEQFYDAYALSKGAAAGGHNPHQHRWSDLLYEVVPNFRVCTFILSNPSYLQTDRLNFLAV